MKIARAKGHLLSFEQGLEIVKSTFYLLENIQHIKQDLANKGYSAFEICDQYHCSYCSTTEDCTIHQRCVVEETKETLLSATRMLPGFSLDRDNEIRSDYLQTMRSRRDASNGCTYNELKETFPDPRARYVRMQFDPCIREMMREKYYNPSRFEMRLDSFERSVSHRIEDEADAAISETDVILQCDRKQLRNLAIEHVGEISSSLGFTYNKSMSSKYWPVFWKPLTDFWGLRWHFRIESDWVHWISTSSDDEFSRPNPYLVPCLTLCPNYLRGNIDKNAVTGEWLNILYRSCLSGFQYSYLRFANERELKLCLQANLELLKHIITPLEHGILRILAPAAHPK